MGVVGGGAAGVEAALAAAAILESVGASASVCLITGQHGLLPGHALAVRRRVAQALRDTGIEVIQRRAVGTAQGVLLDDGQARCLDAVIAAQEASADAPGLAGSLAKRSTQQRLSGDPTGALATM